ncbi:uncharacterized protein LAESUDRAFT_719433 [Laetiporus sulphureus 93-53]|uniref:Uncharacterized protein n=1 Tax=Laetiporus sulphureus 93-53 TaxID=1314785 RepID=A0A165IIF1_9APHY|nr:uncharacterized protein LAESUDRAFT_719433 [Laetiporus sulphureus 93-53]KZT13119.1 hypothetical protein LAESUDRAFT_719433 [Laetiporus sulphureus 93-53]
MSFGTISGGIGVYAAGLATWGAISTTKWTAKELVKELRATMKNIQDLRSNMKPTEQQLISESRPGFFDHWDTFMDDMNAAIVVWDEEARGGSYWQKFGPTSQLKQDIREAINMVENFRSDILRQRQMPSDAELVPSRRVFPLVIHVASGAL